MAKQKKRGFFSWLGFGEKEQETEQKTEEQQAVEEQSQQVTPVARRGSKRHRQLNLPPHSKEEVETFAEEVVEVTEQVQEEREARAGCRRRAGATGCFEHEELPLPEEVEEQEIGLPKSGRPKRKTLKSLR